MEKTVKFENGMSIVQLEERYEMAVAADDRSRRNRMKVTIS